MQWRQLLHGNAGSPPPIMETLRANVPGEIYEKENHSEGGPVSVWPFARLRSPLSEQPNPNAHGSVAPIHSLGHGLQSPRSGSRSSHLRQMINARKTRLVKKRTRRANTHTTSQRHSLFIGRAWADWNESPHSYLTTAWAPQRSSHKSSFGVEDPLILRICSCYFSALLLDRPTEQDSFGTT